MLINIKNQLCAHTTYIYIYNTGILYISCIELTTSKLFFIMKSYFIIRYTPTGNSSEVYSKGLSMLKD